MKRPSLVSAGSLDRLLQSAGEAWKRCDFTQAIETLQRASRLNPSNPAIHFELGRMNGLRFDYAAAELCFEQAIRVSPRKTEALALAGANSKNFLNPGLTEKYFRRAAEQKDATPELLVDLAATCERLRRWDEAVELCERALRLNPRCAAAILVRARLDRQAGKLEAAEKLLRTLPANAAPIIHVRANYELGNILDRLGRYDEAMSAFRAAKALMQPHSGPPLAELKIVRDRIRYMTANISPNLLQKWADAASELQPFHRLALLGGHPRSGTTLLEQVLDAHPDMVSAEETEIFYNDAFGPLLRGHPDDSAMFAALADATPAALRQSRQNYFRAMDLSLGQPVGARLLIDKNPSYTFFIPALARIFPEIKFLIALRDPRDIVLSCYMQTLALTQTGAAFLSLEGTVTEYCDLMTVWQTTKARMKNPFLEVRYEDMVADLESVARPTLEFLGVPWDARVLGFDEHARKKTVRSPTYAEVTQPVYKRAVGRWEHYRKYLEPHLEKLEPFVKAFGYG